MVPRTAVLVAVLVPGLAITLLSRGADPRLGKAYRSADRGGWIQVHLAGKPGEIGYQHGYLLAPEIAANFKAVSTEMVHEERHPWEYFRKAAQDVLASCRAGVPRMGMRFTIIRLSRTWRGECSSAASTA